MSIQPIGYVGLLRNNKAFRRLWYGQVVSQLGDWFDSIALFALLLRLTGSGLAVGTLMVAQFLPSAIVGLFAGVVVDRTVGLGRQRQQQNEQGAQNLTSGAFEAPSADCTKYAYPVSYIVSTTDMSEIVKRTVPGWF
jgi:hypothetical protein